MDRASCILALVALATASAASAEVRQSSTAGFEIVHVATLAAPPADSYALIVDVARWWDPQHSYSGKAGALSIAGKAGGCFCETLDGGGSVEHGRVVYAAPGQALRLNAALGPLQAEGAAGALTFALKPAASGGTEVTMTYVVGGFVRGGGDKIAPVVDQVLGIQIERLRKAAAAAR